MSTARELLDLAAEYVRATDAHHMARGMGVEPVADLDAIAARFETALDSYVRR